MEHILPPNNLIQKAHSFFLAHNFNYKLNINTWHSDKRQIAWRLLTKQDCQKAHNSYDYIEPKNLVISHPQVTQHLIIASNHRGSFPMMHVLVTSDPLNSWLAHDCLLVVNIELVIGFKLFIDCHINHEYELVSIVAGLSLQFFIIFNHRYQVPW